ncbi:MAG TPA: CpsB/CapC family capsule biosynthesis tyrosine phosphatase, partial [Gemmatimonadales bacterium]|nr:CpsB/CapC family capsule biosynthesis tyrosine phosphatase [Gemmatimonadales bacterium]
MRHMGFTDLHSHLVPGVDDGTVTVDESLDTLAALRADGVTAVVTTPHLILPRLATRAGAQRELDRHRAAFERVVEAMAGRDGLPAFELGQEVFAPTAEWIELALPLAGLGLAGGRYLLVEFGFDLAGTHEDVVRAVVDGGRGIIIAHAERYRFPVGVDPIETMHRWRELGALLQVNVGSLSGHYRASSPESERLAWRMVDEGLADLLASDHHGPRREGVSPGAAARLLEERGRGDLVRRLLAD